MDIIISNSSPEPIYEQISRQIKDSIITGILIPGQALPSIRNLARQLRISVITTKRAYEELEREGFIETVGGKGSFVAGQNREFLRETKLREIEEKLVQAVSESRLIDLSLQELLEMLQLLYKEGE